MPLWQSRFARIVPHSPVDGAPLDGVGVGRRLLDLAVAQQHPEQAPPELIVAGVVLQCALEIVGRLPAVVLRHRVPPREVGADAGDHVDPRLAGDPWQLLGPWAETPAGQVDQGSLTGLGGKSDLLDRVRRIVEDQIVLQREEVPADKA